MEECYNVYSMVLDKQYVLMYKVDGVNMLQFYNLVRGTEVDYHRVNYMGLDSKGHAVNRINYVEVYYVELNSKVDRVYHKEMNEMNMMGKVVVMMVYHEEVDSRVYFFELDSRVEEFLVLGESYVVTTVGERMGMKLGSAMVEATWDQCGEGHAGQVGVDDEVLLLSSPDVAHATTCARCLMHLSIGLAVTILVGFDWWRRGCERATLPRDLNHGQVPG